MIVMKRAIYVLYLFLGNELTRVASHLQSKYTSPVSATSPQTNLKKQLSGDNLEAEQVGIYPMLNRC